MRSRMPTRVTRVPVGRSRGFWVLLLAWTFGIAALLGMYAIARTGVVADGSRLVRVVWTLPGLVGGLLPLTVFAAAAALQRGAGKGLWIRLAAVASLCYLAVAIVDPVLRTERRERRGIDVESLEPFGSGTPPALVQQRRAIRENPPATYSFSTNEPLAIPPNWLTHLLHTPVVWAVFTVLNGWLAALLARKQAGLPPVVRVRRLWAQGLLSGFSFLITMSIAGSIVRGSLDVSGAFAAWLPLSIPIAAIWVARRSLIASVDDAAPSSHPLAPTQSG